jgi:hypothetical protein
MQATLAGVKMALSLGGRSLIDTTRYGEIEELRNWEFLVAGQSAAGKEHRAWGEGKE